ncbi:hypothetical protein BC939DRAFT_440973 [Gamsiella multidivaricata]|uniref:uncharacterized protein n=1 Tax=Gamsiella multidivaricata TaxID=101098 RepID=UPI00221F18B9|nr:uncharacterized protein BC939DRAFT_440973 [Gamsiella multidivaricata]KAI7829518.1 hypothetical protein BC939DRAFT_440973 [Gamsiella multidivaricata]
MQTQATVLPSPAWEHQANSSVACPIMNAANFCSTSTLSSRSHSHSFRSFPMMPLFTAPTSPVLLPEIISIVCAYLDAPSLAVATRINRTWSAISLPLLYREITLAWRGFKIDSLELGVRRNGHHCRKLAAAREVVRSMVSYPTMHSITGEEKCTHFYTNLIFLFFFCNFKL